MTVHISSCLALLVHVGYLHYTPNPNQRLHIRISELLSAPRVNIVVAVLGVLSVELRRAGCFLTGKGGWKRRCSFCEVFLSGSGRGKSGREEERERERGRI